MIARFPSLCHPSQFAYEVTDEISRRSNGRFDNTLHLGFQIFMYDTYGHGMTQHGPEFYVTYEYIYDYLASVVAAGLETNEEAEKIRHITWDHWPRYSDFMDHKKILAASQIKHVAKIDDNGWRTDKKAYYSKEDYKVSRAVGKAHDKRWELVEPWMDGSIDAVIGILMNGHGHIPLLTRYAMTAEVQSVLAEANGYCGFPHDEFFKTRFGDPKIHSAFQAYSFMVQSEINRNNARNFIRSIKANIENSLKKAEETKEAS